MATLTTTSFDAYLEQRPLPLVACVGSQHLHSALSNRQHAAAADELVARYLSLDSATSFLDYKEGDEQHEAVVIKRDWLYKHTHAVAAVVSLWCNWGASAEVSEITQLVESFRSRLRPNCRIVLVLVTAADGPLSPAPAGDERLSSLRKACDLDSKSIMLLPVGGDQQAPLIDDALLRRLDRWLLDFAVSHYKDESRRNKKSKKGSPQLLARHHFKRAYYSEFRRDAASALKHWNECYRYLRELLKSLVAPPADGEHARVTLYEVKRAADFVNLKICRALLLQPKQAEA
jgi:hypothetical protein